MIYTITFNPAIDHIVRLSAPFEEGSINRTGSEDYFIGGKGINVSIVLKELGTDSTALGFCAGFTGREIESGLREKGITPDFVFLESGVSRVNVKIKGIGGTESEINSAGPEIPQDKKAEFFEKLSRIGKDDYLILSGSAHKSLGDHIYEEVLKAVSQSGAKCVVDAEKDLLKNSLNYNPFLIKPNNHELAALFDKESLTDEEIVKYAGELQKMGAKNVLVSMAEKGAILITETGEVIKQASVKGKVKNSVGAGDSMVAGFISGYLKSHDYNEALKLGIASGAATAFSDNLATGDYIREIYVGI